MTHAFPAAAEAIHAPPRAGRVLVVANAADPASLELARIYMSGYQMPPGNLLRIPFDNPVNIDSKTLRKRLLDPIEARLKNLPDTVDYIAFMRGVPYRLDGKISVSTAVMFGGRDKIIPVNPYYRQEVPFDSSLIFAGRRLLLPTFITGYTFEDTRRLIENSRIHYPSPAGAGTFYLCEGVGPRGTRKVQIDGALQALTNLQARGERVSGANVVNRMDILGQFTGAPRLRLEGNRYLPGSIVDNMTSWGGYLLDPKNQMSILSFIQHGACGAYGTVSEPTNSWKRWADFSLPVRYVSGFNLAESYYQTVADWRFGLVVGDPLMAPFAHPPSVALAAGDGAVPAGENATIQVTLKEGAAGQGVGSAEFWLDDQVKLLNWHPMLPVGARCGLRLLAGDAVLLEREVSVAEKAEPLGTVLDAFCGDLGPVGKIARSGRRGDKLLFLLQPRVDSQGQIVPLSWEFAVQIGDQAVLSKGNLATQTVLAHAAVLDFGSAPPQPGDKVTVSIEGQSRTAQAFSDTTLEELLGKLVEYMQYLPHLKPGGDYAVKLQKVPLNPARYNILVLSKKTDAKAEIPLTVSVHRSGESQFAAGLEPGNPRWGKIPVGGVSQTYCTPKLPIPSASFSVDIPAEHLFPGPHAVVCVASNPQGVETTAQTFFNVVPANGKINTARFSNTTYDYRDRLMVYLTAPPELETAWPKLVVDDLVVCAWTPGTLVGEFRLDGVLVSPGKHTVWIEWGKDGGLPGPTRRRFPLARSEISRIFVRRPLTATVDLLPDAVKAGTAKIQLKGPYLHDRIRVMTEREPLSLTRNINNPAHWDLDIGKLTPGIYPLTLIGEAETEQSGTLNVPLAIQWRDEKQE